MKNIVQINELSSHKSRVNSNGTIYTLVGHDGKVIPETIDAKVWAQEFVKISDRLILDGYKPEEVLKDEGWMISWFANAIEAGRRW